MDTKLLTTINQQVYRKFPDVKGVPPRIQQSSVSKSGFLLIYRTRAMTPTQMSFDRIVRVLVDESGKIIKMSTSR